MNGLKALVIQAPFETDMGNIIQIARSEGMKIFHNPSKIKVVEATHSANGYWVVVVQNGEGSISESKKMNE